MDDKIFQKSLELGRCKVILVSKANDEGVLNMKKLIKLAFGAALALIFLAGGSTTVFASGPSLRVDPVYSANQLVTGQATKGVNIIVREGNKKTLGTATTSKKTGAYTVKLSTRQAAGKKLYVYAKDQQTKAYFYRVVTVKRGGVNPAVTKIKPVKVTKPTQPKKPTKPVKTSKAPVAIPSANGFQPPVTPTGLWTSNTYKGWHMAISFRQTTGVNQRVYEGKKATAPLINAAYKVTPKTATFWQINVTAKGGAKSNFYIRFIAADKFVLVNAKNQAVKMSLGAAPAGKYVFTLGK